MSLQRVPSAFFMASLVVAIYTTGNPSTKPVVSPAERLRTETGDLLVIIYCYFYLALLVTS